MIEIIWIQMLVGLLLGVGIAYLAFKAGSLSGSGFWAASFLGLIIFGLGGLGWAIILLVFFTSSNILSRLFHKQKSAMEEKFSKSSRRDWAQVFANGGMAAVMALTAFIIRQVDPQSDWLVLCWYAFAASLAAATADTWATEIGVLSRTWPISLRTFKPVEPGSSGAVSLAGWLAATSGAALIALLTALADWLGWGGKPIVGFSAITVYMIIILAGMFGALVDSALGATCQALYYCAVCKKETERHPQHLCGNPTTQVRGMGWMNNDWVNLICVSSAPLLAFLLLMIK